MAFCILNFDYLYFAARMAARQGLTSERFPMDEHLTRHCYSCVQDRQGPEIVYVSKEDLQKWHAAGSYRLDIFLIFFLAGLAAWGVGEFTNWLKLPVPFL